MMKGTLYPTNAAADSNTSAVGLSRQQVSVNQQQQVSKNNMIK